MGTPTGAWARTSAFFPAATVLPFCFHGAPLSSLSLGGLLGMAASRGDMHDACACAASGASNFSGTFGRVKFVSTPSRLSMKSFGGTSLTSVRRRRSDSIQTRCVLRMVSSSSSVSLAIGAICGGAGLGCGLGMAHGSMPPSHPPIGPERSRGLYAAKGGTSNLTPAVLGPAHHTRRRVTDLVPHPNNQKSGSDYTARGPQIPLLPSTHWVR